LFYPKVSDVRQKQDQPRASPCHKLAGQCINLSTDRFKAQAALPGALPPPTYLRFLLVVVVIKLNQILNLLMTLDATTRHMGNTM
jgi:hypothetical protein